jgi:hypothetical protein
MKINDIPEEVIEEYQLTDKATADCSIYIMAK